MSRTPGCYDEDFRVRVVDRFIAYFEASSGLTSAARCAGEDFGVVTTTVLSWAEAQQRMPRPTWGEIRRLRSQNIQLRARITELEESWTLVDHQGGEQGP